MWIPVVVMAASSASARVVCEIFIKLDFEQHEMPSVIFVSLVSQADKRNTLLGKHSRALPSWKTRKHIPSKERGSSQG